MKVLISGASGLLGKALTASLGAKGHEVVALSRSARRPGDLTWNPASGELNGDINGFDAIIHLAGDNIGEGRWNAAKKKRIRDSRVLSTDLLASRAAASERKPRVFLSASATGIYGDRGDAELTETDPPGKGYLVDIVSAWEAAARPVKEAGIRLVNLRIGIVLTPEGGALAAMLPLFRLGGGGRLGSGDQYWSWIALGDLVGAIEHIIATDSIEGPVNLTAPEPATNTEFTRALGRTLGRPTIFPAPAFALRLALGRQKADEMLLASTRALPNVLAWSGFSFQWPTLEDALGALLK